MSLATMTGLLSVFSLLPVRLLQKRGEEEEGDEEEGKKKRALGGRSHDGGESSCSDVITTERWVLDLFSFLY